MNSLYKFIEDYKEETGKTNEEIINSVKIALCAIDYIEKLRNANDDYFTNRKFRLTPSTGQWQLKEEEAGGEYVVLSAFSEWNSSLVKRNDFLCKNLSNNKLYLIDKETLIYFLTMANTDQEIGKFVYVGHISGGVSYKILSI